MPRVSVLLVLHVVRLVSVPVGRFAQTVVLPRANGAGLVLLPRVCPRVQRVPRLVKIG